MPANKDQLEKLVMLFDQFNHITSHFQLEMSEALLENPANKKDLEKFSLASEEVMQHRINRAVFAFVGAMPLACLNGINIFMEALAIHANLTGDTTMHDVIERLNAINTSTENN